ncbi:MAG: hypothetical protein HY078_09540 [Elusimicrobia bacterium]|nr:hypothetical protein [Elusimicrobiota bacterium]
MAEEAPIEVLNPASELLYKTLMRSLMEEGGKVHIETAITAAAALGGVALLRSTRPDFSGTAEGSKLVLPEVNAQAPRILQLMIGILESIGAGGKEGWETPIPTDHAPHRPGPELVRRFEKEAREIYFQFSIPDGWTAAVGALAAVKIAHLAMTKKVLDLDIGKALIMTAFTESAMSVPLRPAA